MDPVSLILFANEAIVAKTRATAAKTKTSASSSASISEGEQPLLRQLEICRQQIDNVNSLSHPLADTERKFIIDTLAEIQSSLHLDIAQSLRRLLSTNVVPRSLHMTHAPGCLPYEQAGGKCEFEVRASGYLSNSKKVASDSSLFVQRSIQVIHSDSFHTHVAQQPWCAIPASEPDNVFFIVTYILPGTPRIHVVCLYMAAPDTLDAILQAQETFQQHHHSSSSGGQHNRRHHHSLFSNGRSDSTWHGWRGLVARMFVGQTAASSSSAATTTTTSSSTEGKAAVEINLSQTELDEDFLNSRLKLIPTMIEANWAVKMAVGHRPAILGTKIPLRYFKGKNYVEVDIDLSTSTIATGIMGMVTGLSKHMVVDLGWTLQGEVEHELPERILSQTRYYHVDLEDGGHVE